MCAPIRKVNQAQWRMARVDVSAQYRQAQPGIDLTAQRVPTTRRDHASRITAR